MQGCDGECGRDAVASAAEMRGGCDKVAVLGVARCRCRGVVLMLTAADLGIFASRLKIFDYFNIS